MSWRIAAACDTVESELNTEETVNEAPNNKRCWHYLAIRYGCVGPGIPQSRGRCNYSYLNYNPSSPYSQTHSLNGGGGELNINVNEFLGFKMDLQGYGSTLTGFNIAPNSTFPLGAQGHVEGNLFTYLFGPQIKVRTHHIQPYVQVLFGGAHTNVYGNAFRTICPPIVGACGISRAPSAEAFAMDSAVAWTSQWVGMFQFARPRLITSSLDSAIHLLGRTTKTIFAIPPEFFSHSATPPTRMLPPAEGTSPHPLGPCLP